VKALKEEADTKQIDSCEEKPLNRAELEADLLLSEDGEARRRFLKQALLAGGGVAAANLLFEYDESQNGYFAVAWRNHHGHRHGSDGRYRARY